MQRLFEHLVKLLLKVLWQRRSSAMSPPPLLPPEFPIGPEVQLKAVQSM